MPEHASLSGFLLLDKTRGITSNQALTRVKMAFPKCKAGFAGILDPDATGLLVIGMGKATRLLELVDVLPKTYHFLVVPGVTSDTYDLTGKVSEHPGAREVSRAEVEAALAPFRGEIDQTPPVYSALKIRGKRACDRARAGEELEMKPRRVQVHQLKLLEWEPKAWKLELVCSKGTYVRSIAHDLGQALGCGAVASGIRRTAVGHIRVEDAVTDTDPAAPPALRPLVWVSEGLPTLSVPARSLALLAAGQVLLTTQYTGVDGLEQVPVPLARALDERGELVAIGELDIRRVFLPKKVFLSQ